jgi:hypothetical protein
MAITSLITMLAQIPISIPGLGVQQTGLVDFFSLSGMPQEAAPAALFDDPGLHHSFGGAGGAVLYHPPDPDLRLPWCEDADLSVTVDRMGGARSTSMR